MMEPSDPLEVPFERLPQRVWQHHPPILLSFPTPHGDLPPLKIEILHPELKALLQSEPGAIEEGRHNAWDASQLVQNLPYLGRAEHNRHLRRHPCPRQQLDHADVLTQHLAIEKQHTA